jgi:hypothetical protein
MRASEQQLRRWAVAVALAVLAAARPAAAQKIIWNADLGLNAGYQQTTQGVVPVLSDPNADPEDIPDRTTSSFFTEIRPGISFSSGRPRLIWTAGYQFSTNLQLGDTESAAFTNQGNASLATQPTKYTLLTLNASFSQGGTAFLLGSRPVETAEPEIRAPANPNTVAANLGETLSWSVGKLFNLTHGGNLAVNTPQDDLGQYSASLSGSLGIERQFRRDNVGLDVRITVSRLRPPASDLPPYTSTSNAIIARWNRDFSYKWNGLATAGVEQVYVANSNQPITGNEPFALLPIGSAAVRYTMGNTAGAVEFFHGSAPNLQTGTVSLTDRITVRGAYTLNVEKLRTVSLSTGFLHNEPIGDTSMLVSAGNGNAVSADAGFSTALTKAIFLNVRYSLAYQYGQGGGTAASLAHIATVGVTGRYTNADQPKRERPKALRGNRVDGTDGAFPIGGDAPTAP